MRKISLYYGVLLMFLLSAYVANAQRKGYWQQRVDYVMTVDFDVNTHQFTGKQKITYRNESGDTLTRAFYHLFFNAFQPNSVMDVRSRQLPDPDPRVKDRIQKLKPDEQGWHKILTLKQDGLPAKYVVEGTILEVELPKQILPGGTAVLEMEFQSQVPVQIRRSGRYSAEGVAYSMSQWYPKLCAYDEEGWHPNPYIGREFYGDFGNFDVTISIDKRFVLGASGLLQNPQECGHGYEKSGLQLNLPAGDKLKWHFVAENVHDFAWGADPNFAHDQLQVPDGPLLHFFYKKNEKYTPTWKDFQPYMSRFFVEMNRRFGKYPYPQFTFYQGGDGGMEYPMFTLITGNRSLPSLVGVSVHEAIHNWFYGVLASNEAKYPWMDEGFTVYASEELMDFLFEKNNPFHQQASYPNYHYLDSIGRREVLCTHADWYLTNTSFSVSAYSSGAVFLNQLSYVVGKENFDKGMLRYFDEWKFKHPKPQDFIRVMEKASGFVLQWYLEQFVYSVNSIDYSLVSAEGDGQKTRVLLANLGTFPMPIDIMVELKNGDKQYLTIPLDVMRGAKKRENNIVYTVLPDWNWVNPTYEFTVDIKKKDIKRIEIDPSRRLADKKRGNNVLTF